MQNIKSRLYASSAHLMISLCIAGLAALLVFFIWYPSPYRDISGGKSLFLLMMVVDVGIGPLLTFVAFNKNKTRKHLKTDISIIALLQILALGYSLWAVYEARPVHLVFEYNRMNVVHASEIDPEMLKKAPPGLRTLPLTGPTLLSLRPLLASEFFDSTLMAVGGIAQAAQPQLWQSYDLAKEEISKESVPAAKLITRFPENESSIRNAVAKTGKSIEHLRSLPLISRSVAWTVLLDDELMQPVGYINLDSF